MRSLREVAGFDVFANDKRIGRIGHVLFAPNGTRVLGFSVERTRLLYLIDRRDRYVALDSVAFAGGAVRVTSGREAWDRAAASRTGTPWDGTVIWLGMPVFTESGTELGVVRDGLFAEKTGELDALGLSAGAARDVAIGVRDIDGALVLGFDGAAVRVRDEAASVEVSGGAAAAAGRGAAVAKQRVGEAAEVAGAAARKAAAYGSATIAVAAKSRTARKAAGWFKAIKDEVVDAMGDPDDE